MSPLKTFNQFILENSNNFSNFEPQYFKLPYSIPEDRFEKGFLKTNTSRKTNIRREISSSQPKYTSINDFLDKNPIEKVEKSVLAEINRVVKFISNNPLTGKKVECSFNMDFSSLEEYIKYHYLDPDGDLDAPLGGIETNLPFSNFGIRVDYDIYKNIPVFTFWYDGDLFYYYTVFTLEPNDVIGSGEVHTYITADEVINYLFYETVWRAAIIDLYESYPEEVEKLNISEELLDKITINPNYPKQITDNYLNKKFTKLLSNWLSTGAPVGKKSLTISAIPNHGLMSLPGDADKVLKFEPGGSSRDYSIRLLMPPSYEVDKIYLALKFNIDYRDHKITSVDMAQFKFEGRSAWAEEVDWKPLSQSDVNTLYFFDHRGNPIWIKQLMHS